MSRTESQAVENKRIIQQIFDAMAEGDWQPLIDHFADDICFVVMGTGSWSRSYDGKTIVLAELFTPLRERLAGRIIVSPLWLIAEGDHVVVQAQGNNTTIDGKAYDNIYCNVIRLEAGRIAEWTEYCDTLLVETALGRQQAALTA
jgi:ketosteroid isomerase-like protein